MTTNDIWIVITQCCMRHLYELSKSGDRQASAIIDRAKEFERRRCGHLPADYPEPLSAVDCIASVVDPKGSGRNKHRYVIASTDPDVREKVEGILGTPLVFVNKSVMIMAKMPENTQNERDREERLKLRDQIKKVGGNKRKRDEEGEDRPTEGEDQATKKKKTFKKGPKEPNPLSVKKPKKKTEDNQSKPRKEEKTATDSNTATTNEIEANDATEPGAKRKRKRKHKSAVTGDENTGPTDNAGEQEE